MSSRSDSVARDDEAVDGLMADPRNYLDYIPPRAFVVLAAGGRQDSGVVVVPQTQAERVVTEGEQIRDAEAREFERRASRPHDPGE